MLDILIVLDDVGEHVVHVVLRTPPLSGKPSEESGLEATELIQDRVAVMNGRVADPSNDDLCKAESKDAEPGVRGHAADEPASANEHCQ